MDSTDDINQELEDILLDDLVEAQKRMTGASGDTATLTPGQGVHEDRRGKIIDEEIKRLSDSLKISESTQTTAKTLFDQYVEQNEIAGHAIEVLAAACLYTACKVESVPLSPDDFGAVPATAYTRVILLRRVKTIASSLGLNPRAFFDPTQYVDHYCESLDLGEDVTKRAHEVITAADVAGIGGGKSPTGRAAGAVYNACLDLNLKVTQSEISDVADVTNVTIRNRYQDQREHLYPLSTAIESESASGDSGPGGAVTPKESAHDQVFPDVSRYVGKSVAKKIETAISRLDRSEVEFYSKCVSVCRRVHDSQVKPGLDTDDVLLALAIIRLASEEFGAPVSYTQLHSTLESSEDEIHSLASVLRERLRGSTTL